MKKLIILVIVSMIFSNAFAQNSLNPKTLIGIDISTSASSTLNSSTFNRNYSDNHFLRAWNWGDLGGNDNLDNVLGINSYHQFPFAYDGYRKSSTQSATFSTLANGAIAKGYAGITTIDFRSAGRRKPEAFNGLGIYLEPALNVSTSNTFTPNNEAD